MRFKDYDKLKLIVRLLLADRIRNVCSRRFSCSFLLVTLQQNSASKNRNNFLVVRSLSSTGCKLFENLKNKEKSHMYTQYIPAFNQQQVLRQRKRHSKISICTLATISRLLLLIRILYIVNKATLKMDQFERRIMKYKAWLLVFYFYSQRRGGQAQQWHSAEHMSICSWSSPGEQQFSKHELQSAGSS